MLTQMQQNQWRTDAECQGMDSDLFFPPPYIGEEKRYEYERIAISICKSCLVKKECRSYALSDPVLVTDGVWGGLTYRQIKSKRRRKKYEQIQKANR